MDKLEDLATLIVDAQPAMRSGLRAMLTQCGVRDIEDAAAANIGLQKLQQRRYDLVVCEYNLGEGQDGQHFLEDARAHGILPYSTIFIMVTGESGYGRVVSAAELAPSDYILKPFAAERLYERIERAVTKRAAFLPVHRAMELGNLHGAIRACERCEKRFPQYLLDFLRLKAELYLATGEPDLAHGIYAQVVAARAVPWARLGLAKALFMQKRFADAEQALAPLIAENRHYVDAFDWLARTKEALGDLKAAQGVIRDAVAVSPHALRRLRRLGEVSLEAGDAECAERALAEVVRKGKYSEFRDPEDHVMLVKTQVAKGDREAAEKTVRDLEKSMRGIKKTDACAALSSAMVLERAGEEAGARRQLARALAANGPEAGLSERAKLELARGCLAFSMESEAGELLQDVVRNAADPRTLEQARSVLKRAGKEALGEEIEARVQREVVDLVAQGAAKAEAGDHDGAVQHMLEAARRMPGNAQVALNAALALLKHIEHCGWEPELAAQARAFLDRARRRDPSQARLAALAAYYHQMLGKYGIGAAGPAAPRRATA
jgi:DNA-binding NarL/FixJ family response regulator/Flp pilus assembly protein TadD